MARKTYRGKAINVSFDLEQCIHAGKCVRGMPEVFDTEKRPWIQPDNGDAEAIRALVATCPTGALAIPSDAPSEPATRGPTANEPAATAPAGAPAVSMRIKANGPVLVTGPCAIEGPDGKPVPIERETFALCRCGLTANKPFCDGAHARAGWSAGD